MKKYLLSILIIGLSLLLLVGCGSTSTTDTSTSDKSTDDTEMSEDLKDEIVGEWEASGYKDDFEYEGTKYTGEDSFTYTFNEDGTYSLVIASSEKAEGEDDVSSGSINVEGDYTVDGDEVTLSVATLDGMDREEYTASNPDNTDVVFFEDATLTATINGDKLTLESDEMTLTLTKVEK